MDTDSRAQRTRDAFNSTLDETAVPWSELAGYRREAWRVAADVATSGLYELVPAASLKTGDHIYVMGERLIVTDEPYHPDGMTDGPLWIPVFGGTLSSPLCEPDYLIPRMVAL